MKFCLNIYKLLRNLTSHWKKEKFRCYEAKTEESEKAGSRWESHPGHLACAASALPLSCNNQTTTSPHNPLYVLHRCLIQLHTQQPLSMHVPSELS